MFRRVLAGAIGVSLPWCLALTLSAQTSPADPTQDDWPSEKSAGSAAPAPAPAPEPAASPAPPEADAPKDGPAPPEPSPEARKPAAVEEKAATPPPAPPAAPADEAPKEEIPGTPSAAAPPAAVPSPAPDASPAPAPAEEPRGEAPTAEVDDIKPIQPLTDGHQTRIGTFHRRMISIYPNPDPGQRNITPITKVELYVTRDHGNTWAPADPASVRREKDASDNPFFLFTALEDGEFGFWIRMEDEKWSTPPPQPGDAPQLLAKIDTTVEDQTNPYVPPAETGEGYPHVPADFLTVDIRYSTAGTGLSGLKSVHLWYTSDGGKTWNYYGQDTDGESPVRFHAPEEGVYGFRLVAVNQANAPSRNPPASGDRPDRSFRIVANAPEVRLFQPAGGHSIQGGAVYPIRWHVFDPFIRPEKPIRVLVSENGGLSWKVLADELPNTGEYAWKVPPVNSRTWQIQVISRDIGNIEVASKSSGNFTVDSRKIDSPRILDAAAPRPAGGQVAVSRDASPDEAERWGRDDELYRKATRLRWRQAWDEALAAYEEVLKRDPGHYGALNDAATIHYQRGRYEQALAYFDRAVAADGQDACVRMNAGICHQLLGHRREALDRYREVVLMPSRSEKVTDDELGKRLLALAVECDRAGFRDLSGECAQLGLRLTGAPAATTDGLRRYLR